MLEPYIAYRGPERVEVPMGAGLSKLEAELNGVREGRNNVNGVKFIVEKTHERSPSHSLEKRKARGTRNFKEELVIRIPVNFPEHYWPFVIAHELTEFESDSHEEALRFELEYAQKVLDADAFHLYQEWRGQHDDRPPHYTLKYVSL